MSAKKTNSPPPAASAPEAWPCCLDRESGLYHEDHFYSVLQQELARLDRWGRPLSLALLELADLSANAWAALGRLALISLRRLDLAARLDRDTLAVLMPDADESRAAGRLAEFLRQALAEGLVVSGKFRQSLTLALPWEGLEPGQLVDRGRRNLTEAPLDDCLAADSAPAASATAIAADERSLLFEGFKGLDSGA